MAVCSVAAYGAPVKTSKPVPLRDTEMASVKGQSDLYVFVWNQQGSGPFYTAMVWAQYLGYQGYAYQLVYSGGPLAGTYFIGSESPPPPPMNPGAPYYNFDWINRDGTLNTWHPFINPTYPH